MSACAKSTTFDELSGDACDGATVVGDSVAHGVNSGTTAAALAREFARR